MVEVHTLYKLCLKNVVQYNILPFPVDIKNHIPHTIYVDVWGVQEIKNLQEQARANYNMLSDIEAELDDSLKSWNYHVDIQDKVSLDMQKIEMIYPQHENSPPAPEIIQKLRSESEIMFLKLSDNFSLITNKMMEIENHHDIKYRQFCVIVKEKKKLKKLHGDFDFKLNHTKLYQELDNEFERRISDINSIIHQNVHVHVHHGGG